MLEDFIPLPSEMPRAANLDEVPHYIKISKTVESLIGQNEDLMARLKVNIRQNTLLESQLRDQEQAAKQHKLLHSKVASQLEILTEKECLLRQKLDAQDLELEQAREFLNINSVSEKELNKLKAYQRRVRRWVRSMISKMNYKIKMLAQKNEQLENDVIEQQKKILQSKTKMNEAVHNLQLKEREHQRDKVQLIEDFENRTLQLNRDNQTLTADNKSLSTKLQSFVELQKKLTQYQSLAQNFEKKYDDLKRSSEQKITRLDEDLHRFMTENETLKLQNDSIEKTNEEVLSQNRVLLAKNHEVMSRFEAMNVLWSDTQIQRAQQKMKNDAMIKLNQSLSMKIKEQMKKLDAANVLTKQEKSEHLENIYEIENLMAEIEASILKQNDM